MQTKRRTFRLTRRDPSTLQPYLRLGGIRGQAGSRILQGCCHHKVAAPWCAPLVLVPVFWIEGSYCVNHTFTNSNISRPYSDIVFNPQDKTSISLSQLASLWLHYATLILGAISRSAPSRPHFRPKKALSFQLYVPPGQATWQVVLASQDP